MRASLRPSRAVLALALSAMALIGAACSDSPAAPLAPFEPQINNIADNFEFQATGVTDVTWTFTYAWSNSGAAASVNQSTTVSAGAAVVTVYDAVGTQVYSQSLSANGTFDTTAGVAGTWTIKVAFTTYDGTVNFRVQKK